MYQGPVNPVGCGQPSLDEELQDCLRPRSEATRVGDDANVGRGHGGHHQANGNPFQVNSDDGDDEQDDDVENGDYDGNSEVNGSVVIPRWGSV